MHTDVQSNLRMMGGMMKKCRLESCEMPSKHEFSYIDENLHRQDFCSREHQLVFLKKGERDEMVRMAAFCTASRMGGTR